MAKKRMHQVNAGKAKNPNHVGTITQGDILKMDRAARRQAAIESGHNRTSGCGVHGGNNKQRNKRDRRNGKLEIRNYAD